MAQTEAQRKAKKARKKQAQQVAERKASDRNMIEALTMQLQQGQQAVQAIRAMYDQIVMEKAGLTQKITERDQLITALAIENGPLALVPEAVNAVQAGEYAGYQTDKDENDVLLLVAVPSVDEPTEEEDEDEPSE